MAESRHDSGTLPLSGLTIVPLFLILGYIIFRRRSGRGWALFTERPPPPPTRSPVELATAMLGSLVMVSLASVFAVPIGILAADLFERVSTHWLTRPIRFMTELLRGVPSIVIGIFAYSVSSTLWANTSSGFLGMGWHLCSAVMMLLVVVRATEEAINLVPGLVATSESYALGRDSSANRAARDRTCCSARS